MKSSLGALALLLSVTSGTAAIASCAGSEAEPDPDPTEDAGGSAVEAGVDAPADAPPADARRAPCDAGDPTCTSAVLPCSATDFCPMPVPPALGESYRQYAINGVWGSSATNVYMVGAAGSIAHWDGASLKLEPNVTSNTLNAIWGAGPDNVWVASTPGVILRRTATGWAKTLPAETNAFRLHAVMLRSAWGPADGSTVFLGGDRLTATDGDDPAIQLWTSSTSKVAWTGASQIPFFTVQGVWGTSATDYWAVGYIFQTGVIAYHVIPSSNPKALDWISTDLQTTATMNAVWGSGPNDVWTVGQGGTIRHHVGGPSARWEIVASPTNQDLRAVWGTGPSDAWAAGDGGTLLHWNGTKWRRLVASFPVGTNPDLYGLWGSSPTDVWAVGASGTLLRSTGVHSAEQGGQP